MGFSGSVNGTTKNPGFLDFGFCQCKWAYYVLKLSLKVQVRDEREKQLYTVTPTV